MSCTIQTTDDLKMFARSSSGRFIMGLAPIDPVEDFELVEDLPRPFRTGFAESLSTGALRLEACWPSGSRLNRRSRTPQPFAVTYICGADEFSRRLAGGLRVSRDDQPLLQEHFNKGKASMAPGLSFGRAFYEVISGTDEGWIHTNVGQLESLVEGLRRLSFPVTDKQVSEIFEPLSPGHGYVFPPGKQLPVHVTFDESRLVDGDVIQVTPIPSKNLPPFSHQDILWLFCEELNEAVGEKLRLIHCDRDKDEAFRRLIRLRKTLRGLGVNSSCGIRLRGSELVAFMDLSPFIVETDKDSLCYDMSSKALGAQVEIHISLTDQYPVTVTGSLLQVYIHPKSRSGLAAWLEYPSVNSGSRQQGGMVALICTGTTVTDVIQKTQGKSPGQICLGVLRGGFTSILLGLKASNKSSIHNRPSAFLKSLEDKHLRPVIRVLSYSQAVDKARKTGILFVPFNR